MGRAGIEMKPEDILEFMRMVEIEGTPFETAGAVFGWKRGPIATLRSLIWNIPGANTALEICTYTRENRLR